MGISSGSPNTAADEEKTKYPMPWSTAASMRVIIFPTLLRKYFRGSTTDSPTEVNAAKWITASYGSSEKMRSSSWPSPQSPTMSRLPSAASRWPSQRLSRMTVSMPFSLKYRLQWLPIYPAPPVTSTLMVSSFYSSPMICTSGSKSTPYRALTFSCISRMRASMSAQVARPLLMRKPAWTSDTAASPTA